MPSPEAPALLVEQRGGLAVLTLNRPAQRNAMSPELVCRLADAFEQAEADEAVRVVVLAGSGPMFCAGADLKRLLPLLAGGRPPEDEWDERVLREPILERATQRQAVCSKPIVAAVNGPATAGGMELLLATDLRVASTTATFGLAEATRGLIPGGGGIVRLARQVPRTVALEMLLTGRSIPAERARELGLVNAVVAPEDVLPVAEELALAIAANGPFAVRAIKQVVRDDEGRSLEEALALEAAAFERVLATDDAEEGPRAFAEKRPPRFTGR